MNIWTFGYEKIRRGILVSILYVVESEGSSPGRQGFGMAVAADGSIYGSIGGGIMEHKWVEHVRDSLGKGEQKVQLIPQFHDKAHAKNRSGMICSGHQTLAIIPLNPEKLESLKTLSQALENKSPLPVQLSPEGLNLLDSISSPGFTKESEAIWTYQEEIGKKPVIHILGAGHVGLALSQQMVFLGFEVNIYDDRPRLNTLEENQYADAKIIVDYSRLTDSFQTSPQDYVVIISFGYRTDKIILEQLLDKELFYLGMMGSEAKIKALFEEMKSEGKDPKSWAHIFTPIGLPIHSKSPQEIAVSIAAEIIREKNANSSQSR